MAVEYVSGGNPSGINFGRSDDKIGFFGLSTPIVKPTITLGAGTTTTLLAEDVLAIVTGLAALGMITAG